MIADDVRELTREKVAALVQRAKGPQPFGGDERRQLPRWPVGGMVQLWQAGSGVLPAFGTCRDISEVAVGVTCDQMFLPGMVVNIALELPDHCLHGQGVVRRCTETDAGYDLGIEFRFAD
ncbi:MAG: hypothetical protein AMXMBFR13_25000 [Phycisphaerae bacterium]|jgi:hypothetical protein